MTLADLRELVNSAHENTGIRPDLIVGRDVVSQMISLFGGGKPYRTAGGFDACWFEGILVVEDSRSPDGDVYTFSTEDNPDIVEWLKLTPDEIAGRV
jgi:hypothetical protein